MPESNDGANTSNSFNAVVVGGQLIGSLGIRDSVQLVPLNLSNALRGSNPVTRATFPRSEIVAIAILAMTVSLVGCGRFRSDKWRSAEREELFRKKIECAKFYEKLDKQAQEDGVGTGSLIFVDRVFYSPQLNTCLAAQYVQGVTSDAGVASIYDVLSRRQVWSEKYEKAKPYYVVKQLLEDQISARGLEK